MRLGVLTGGGDCPGLNAVIRAVVRRSLARGHEVIGVLDGAGWSTASSSRSACARSRGSSLGAARSSARPGRTRTRRTPSTGAREPARGRLDALVAIGGEDTLGVAARLHREEQFPVVGVPKTIDNDLAATDYTFGFDTAVFIATEAIDRLHTTAESHNRVMVVEVMGRHTGWIAVMSGIAGGADVILIPEQPITVEEACDEIRRRHERGPTSRSWSSARATSRRTRPARRGSSARRQAPWISSATFGSAASARRSHGRSRSARLRDARHVLGHVQRGGTPTPRDRVLATRYGLKAADLAHERRFGRMAALHGDAIVDVSLDEATKELKTVPPEWYEVAKAFFG